MNITYCLWYISANNVTDFEEWICTEEMNNLRVKFKKNLTDMLQNIFTNLHNRSDESCLAMHKSVASCDHTNKFRQTVFNWIIHQISQN